MTLADLFEMLEMDSPADFEYFEQFAELLECGRDIPFDLFAEVLSGAKQDNLAEFAANYLEEMQNAVPDEYGELALLIENISQQFELIFEGEDESNRQAADELYKLRCWQTEADTVIINGEAMSLMEALAELRVIKLDGSDADCDFSKAMNYELNDLSLSLGRYSKVDL